MRKSPVRLTLQCSTASGNGCTAWWQKIATDRIVILSPRSAQASPVWRKRRLGNFTLVEFPNRPGPGEVTFSTLQRFKGLEADVIILCDVAEGDPTCTLHHLYVGTSRARHVLVVVSR